MARLRALIVLVLFLGSSLPFGNAAHCAFADDAQCRRADDYAPATPHFEPVGALSPLSHCAICHLARTAGSARMPFVAVAAIGSGQADLLARVATALTDVAGDRTHPSRAPPPAA